MTKSELIKEIEKNSSILLSFYEYALEAHGSITLDHLYSLSKEELEKFFKQRVLSKKGDD